MCKEDIERRIFPYAYTYDSGAIKVRTGLPRATVDTLYYASKRVKAQFHRVLGTQEPLAGDPNSTLNIVLYASRADYEQYHPILTGMDTNNGGIYIERGATFYTYERRVPQDSTLTLEELFRHEYTHYLNGRYAVPGFFGEGPGTRTTAPPPWTRARPSSSPAPPATTASPSASRSSAASSPTRRAADRA